MFMSLTNLAAIARSLATVVTLNERDFAGVVDH
jgi:hypothetical protein